MNAVTSQVFTAIAPSEIDPEGLRGRIEATDSQISQLNHIIDCLVASLGPVLLPESKDQSGETAAIHPARSPMSEACHQQGKRIYDAHQRLAELDRRLKL